MATVPALTNRTHAQRWAEVRDEHALWGDLRPELLETVRRILEATMEDELGALVGAARYERNHLRLDVRNGVYYRRLVTELGAITDLAVPRRRLVPYRPSFLRRAARRTLTIDTVLRQAFLRGLSTRERAALAETLTGVALSPARSAGWPGSSTPRSRRSTGGRSRSPPATCSSTGSGSRSARPGAPGSGSSSRRTGSTRAAGGSCSTSARRRPSPRPSGGSCSRA